MIFDINGTLTDILTDENSYDIYRTTANFLDYYGVKIAPDRLKQLYNEYNREQRSTSREEFPEFDISDIFYRIILDFKTRRIDNLRLLADTASIVFRAAGRYKLECYPGVRDVLTELSMQYRMGAVSDGQQLWGEPELYSAGLQDYFSAVVISGDLGYRKPDRRIFERALDAMQLFADEVIFIGNDMYRDIYGAKNAGMKTVLYKSNQGDHHYNGVNADYIIYNFNELPRAIEFLTADQ